MEIFKKKFKNLVVIITIFFTIFIFSGCKKRFWEYECVWVCDSPYIYMPTNSSPAVIEINGEKKDVEAVRKYTTSGLEFRDPDIDNASTDESIIWETECKIKKGKLYVTITKDYVSDMEGKTIILEQQPLEGDSDEE
ncbi:MAG: hypothetical protein K2M78_08785 [Lachnospiraceae bacterium]|nr:hypothetical protein [Lachnospiraceae bacterium]